MNIFKCETYKQALKIALETKKKQKPNYTFEHMAKACGVQKAYLSRVINHKGNLSSDQVYLACEYLKLTHLESDFIFNLFNYESTTLEKRRRHYINIINELRKKAFRTDANLKLDNTIIVGDDSQQDLSKFYSDPYYSLIHMFLTLKEYSENPLLFEKALSLPKEKITYYLEQLKLIGFISKHESKWKVLKRSIHLPEDSYLIKAHRNLLRLKSLEKIDRLSETDYQSVSILFSTNNEIQQKIREKLLQFLKETEKLVHNSSELEVYQINFDLLKWS